MVKSTLTAFFIARLKKVISRSVSAASKKTDAAAPDPSITSYALAYILISLNPNYNFLYEDVEVKVAVLVEVKPIHCLK